MTLPAAAEEILGSGTLCYLAAPTRRGPHLTPVVFVFDGGRLWLTTGRGTVKARAWRREPLAQGLVRMGDRAVAFRGAVNVYDALDPSTWGAIARAAPGLARASLRFTLKNARYFAGYARDAYRVPLSWTPPARVTVGVDLEAGAVLAGAQVQERWGTWGTRVSRVSGEPKPGSGIGPPDDLEVGDAGDGVLAMEGAGGGAVLPGRWSASDGAYDVVVPRRVLALAGARARTRAALVVDRASAWRASRMRGVLVQGAAEVHAAEAIPGALARAGAAIPARDAVVVRLSPERVVWWRGWASGTVAP